MWLFDYYVYMMLQMKFGGPAAMIARTDALESWAKHIKSYKIPVICKP